MVESGTTMQSLRTPVIVTGLSGAGLSSALKALEDMGFEVFDNFPLALIPPLVAETHNDGMPIAIGVDSRTRGFDPEALLAAAERLQARLVYLTCDTAVLQKRFTETRRRHPVARDRPVSAGIKREQEWLHPLRAAAEIVIDTSELSVHDLRRLLESRFGTAPGGRLNITVTSFGYRFGIPRDADLVMDVRFLNNPHWVQGLRPLTGLDREVGVYVGGDPDFVPFMERLQAMLSPLLPRYAHEGKTYLTVALGCTGGRHRSVYTAEQLGAWFQGLGYATNVVHRDVTRSQ